MVSSPSQRARTMDVADEGNFVYGTDINEAQVKNDFRRFIRSFQLPDQEQNHYLQELHRVWDKQSNKAQGIKFTICGSHIYDFNKKLYDHLVTFPTEMIPIFDYELWDISLRDLHLQPEDLGPCQVKINYLLESDSKVM